MTKEAFPSPRLAAYVALIAIQTVGAVLLVWGSLPVFRQISVLPGKQVPSDSLQWPLLMIAILIMQASYWYRFLRVPLLSPVSRIVPNHLFTFMSRLSFVFGAGLFSLTIFRHLPDLVADVDLPSLLGRGALLAVSLFALFCFTLELERLGKGFE